jgi:CRISPR-associated protein Cas6
VRVVEDKARSGELFFQMDVRPPFLDTPESWEDKLEAAFAVANKTGKITETRTRRTWFPTMWLIWCTESVVVACRSITHTVSRWLFAKTEEQTGIHLIHGAESGNGWMRPKDAGNELLHLSHRSRMTLRVPKHRIDDAHKLSGQTLDIDGHRLEVGQAKVKLFSTLPTQFARYVVVPQGIEHDDEEAFMAYAVGQLRELDIKVRKLLCGRAHAIRHPDSDLNTRSLMLADLEVEEAVTLQQQGIGRHKTMGCGLFIPHKGIRAVHEMTADKQS